MRLTDIKTIRTHHPKRANKMAGACKHSRRRKSNKKSLEASAMEKRKIGRPNKIWKDEVRKKRRKAEE